MHTSKIPSYAASVRRRAFFARASAFAMIAAMAAAPASAQTVAVASNTFEDGAGLAAQQVSDAKTCGGQNVSPELHWSDVPTGTKAFALTVFDPQAKGGAGAFHWVVWDVPATVSTLAAGSGRPAHAPTGSIAGRNDMGIAGYSGPCPPGGDSPHTYVFTVYAVGVEKLDVPATATPQQVVAALKPVTIESGHIDGKYAR